LQAHRPLFEPYWLKSPAWSPITFNYPRNGFDYIRFYYSEVALTF